MLIENFPFFLRTQQLGSQKEREQSLQNSENSMFWGLQTNKSYQSLHNSVVSIFWVRKKKGTNRCKIFLASFGLTPADHMWRHCRQCSLMERSNTLLGDTFDGGRGVPWKSICGSNGSRRSRKVGMAAQ